GIEYLADALRLVGSGHAFVAEIDLVAIDVAIRGVVIRMRGHRAGAWRKCDAHVTACGAWSPAARDAAARDRNRHRTRDGSARVGARSASCRTKGHAPPALPWHMPSRSARIGSVPRAEATAVPDTARSVSA